MTVVINGRFGYLLFLYTIAIKLMFLDKNIQSLSIIYREIEKIKFQATIAEKEAIISENKAKISEETRHQETAKIRQEEEKYKQEGEKSKQELAKIKQEKEKTKQEGEKTKQEEEKTKQKEIDSITCLAKAEESTIRANIEEDLRAEMKAREIESDEHSASTSEFTHVSEPEREDIVTEGTPLITDAFTTADCSDEVCDECDIEDENTDNYQALVAVQEEYDATMSVSPHEDGEEESPSYYCVIEKSKSSKTLEPAT